MTREYITDLQRRRKDRHEKQNLIRGDMVLLAEDNIPALQ